jgi:hypothetical protein
LNAAVVVSGTLLLDAVGAARGADETSPQDYVVERETEMAAAR